MTETGVDAPPTRRRRPLLPTIAICLAALLAVGATGAWFLIDHDPRPSRTVTVLSGERTMQLWMVPPETGGAEVHVQLGSPRGALDLAREIAVVAVGPDGTELSLEVRSAGPNHVVADRAVLPTAGAWRFDVVADFDDGPATFVATLEVD